MYDASKMTFINRIMKFGEPVMLEGGFSGPIYIEELDSYMLLNSDGVGTKSMVAELVGKYDTLAYDLLAMVCDDAIAVGAEPFALTNTLNVKEQNEEVTKQLAKGLVEASKEAGVAVVGGEIAELSDMMACGYMWDATVAAIVKKEKMITGEGIEPGDHIVGLASDGFRSNGMTLIRKILEKNPRKLGKNVAQNLFAIMLPFIGNKWYEMSFDENKTWGEEVLTPSRIYTPLIMSMHGRYDEEAKIELKGIAHVTGGGIPGNLSRILPGGMGANIRPPEPHKAMLRLQEIGGVDDKEAYKVWNMGLGMIVVTNHVCRINEESLKFGITPHYLGKVTDDNCITLANKGFYKKEKELCFERK
jgi:phosphoribosylformylglycinamidine cyclo-ligase